MKNIQNLEIFNDNRGYVGSLFKQELSDFNFVEDRISYSKKGVVRGFHGDSRTYKLVYCLYGEIRLIIFNIITQTKEDYILNRKSHPILIKPNTLNAHQCLTKDCLLFYKWTEYYSLESQWSVNYNCKVIQPNWTEKITEVSDRDKFAKDFNYEYL